MQVSVSVRIRAPSTDVRSTVPLRGTFGRYLVDSIVGEDATNDEVFSGSVLPLVHKFLQGTSCVCMLYGAQGTGKTYTLEGRDMGVSSSRHHDGVVQRAVLSLIKNLSPVPRHRYTLTAQYLLLSAGFDAAVHDLLAPGSLVSMKDHASAASLMDRATRQSINTGEEIYRILATGKAARLQFGRPAHTLLSITLSGQTASGDQVSTRLTFVELAAPDARDPLGKPLPSADPALSRSLSLSYSSLTAVLSALKAGSSGQHVPWRDSALTRWLKDTLSGSPHTLIMATVSPAPEAAPDTLATLSYVSKLRSGSSGEGVVVTATWEHAAAPLTATAVQPHAQAGDYHREAAPRVYQVTAATPTSANASFLRSSSPPSSRPHEDRARGTSSYQEPTPRSNALPLSLAPTQPLSTSSPAQRPTSGGRGLEAPGRSAALDLRSPRQDASSGVKGGGRAAGAARVASSRNMYREQSLVEELAQQLEAAQVQLAEVNRDRQHLSSFAQELQHLEDTRELEWQAREASLERQVALLQEDARAKAAALTSLTTQLADARAAGEVARSERDRAQGQVKELSERLQEQVRALGEETGRLKSKATDAVARAEREEASRRAAESQLAQLRAQVHSAKSMEAAVQQQVAAMQQQLTDANAVLEQARSERNTLQALKWQLEERVQVIAQELEGAHLARQQAEMQAKADVTKAAAEARAAASETQAMQADLNSARTQAEALRKQVAVLQAAFDEQKRLESSSARDVRDMEVMLREFERDLEVHAAPLWREMRGERADALLLAPDSAQLAPAARWRPIMRSLMAVLRKQVTEAGNSQEMCHSLQQRIKAMEGQLCQAEELQASVAAHTALRTQALVEMEELAGRCRELEGRLASTRCEAERLSGALSASQAELRVREQQLGAASAERDAVQQRAAQVATLQAELKARDQAFDALWAEIRGLRSTLSVLTSARATSPAGKAAHASMLAMLSPEAARLYGEDPAQAAVLDWGSPRAQEQAVRAVAELRSQVAGLVSELGSLRRAAVEAEEVKGQLEDVEGTAAELRARLGALQASHAQLEGDHREVTQARISLERKVSDLEREVCEGNVTISGLRAELAHTQEELRAASDARDAAKEHMLERERSHAALAHESEARAREAAEARAEAQAARTELGSHTSRLRLLEGQLQDAQAQVGTLSARLSATEKALVEANARVTDLNSRLALAETDARLKVSELSGQVAAAEAAERVAGAQQREAVERLEGRVHELTCEAARLASDLEAARAERREALGKADAAQRCGDELRAKLEDAGYVHTQLQAVMQERDGLAATVRQLRGTQAQAEQEVASLTQQLAGLKAELQRCAGERTQLAAELHARKLDDVVHSALARNKAALSPALSPAPPSLLQQLSPYGPAQLPSAGPSVLGAAGGHFGGLGDRAGAATASGASVHLPSAYAGLGAGGGSGSPASGLQRASGLGESPAGFGTPTVGSGSGLMGRSSALGAGGLSAHSSTFGHSALGVSGGGGGGRASVTPGLLSSTVASRYGSGISAGVERPGSRGGGGGSPAGALLGAGARSSGLFSTPM